MASTGHLRALTGLRFIAAFHVVMFHLAPRESVPRVLLPLVNTGYVGVSLFYVLSGFILAYTYTRSSPIAPQQRPRFWQARFARVYPVYLFGLLVALVHFGMWVVDKFQQDSVAVAAGKVGLTAFANLFLLQAWITATIAQWNSPGWSLSCEAFFYFVFPFAAARLHSLGERRLLLVMMAAVVLALIPPLAYLATSPDGIAVATHESSGAWLSNLKFNPLVRLPEFLIGIALGRHFVVSPPRSSGLWLVLLGAISVLLLLCFSESIPYVLLHNGLLALPFAAIVYGLALGGGLIGRALSTAAAVRLGEASYALYILHSPIGWWFGYLNLGSGVGRFASATIAALVLSILVNRFLEEPLRQKLRPVGPSPGINVREREPMPLGGTASKSSEG